MLVLLIGYEPADLTLHPPSKINPGLVQFFRKVSSVPPKNAQLIYQYIYR